MAIIGVAGGSSSIGRAIVEAIKATGRHEVFILSRKKSTPILTGDIAAPILETDYSDDSAIQSLLEKHQIECVISALSTFVTNPGGEEPEIVLIRAANASKCTNRFIPSNWSTRYTDEHASRAPAIPAKLRALSELEKTGLEHTVFINGLFSDYYGMPRVKSYVNPMTLVVDIQRDVAAIPGSGDTPVVFTHSSDVAKFVAAALDLPKWSPESYVIGDKLTWHEFIAIAEDLKKTKFNISYDSVEDLNKGQITELPGHIAAYDYVPKETFQGLLAGLEYFFADGSFDLDPQKSLNELFPHIKPRSVRSILTEAFAT